MNEPSVSTPATGEETYDEVTCFDGGLGRYGQYARVTLPRPMTKREACDYCRETDRCPPEAFHKKDATTR